MGVPACVFQGGQGENTTPEAAETRLLEFCRQLVTRAADDTARKSGMPMPQDPHSLMMPPRSRWEQAVRAPVIAKALEAYRWDEPHALHCTLFFYVMLYTLYNSLL